MAEEKKEKSLLQSYPEFIKESINPDNRKATSYSDEFVIRRARIYQPMGSNDKRDDR